jgi:hypothetical protein
MEEKRSRVEELCLPHGWLIFEYSSLTEKIHFPGIKPAHFRSLLNGVEGSFASSSRCGRGSEIFSRGTFLYRKFSRELQS